MNVLAAFVTVGGWRCGGGGWAERDRPRAEAHLVHQPTARRRGTASSPPSRHLGAKTHLLTHHRSHVGAAALLLLLPCSQRTPPRRPPSLHVHSIAVNHITRPAHQLSQCLSGLQVPTRELHRHRINPTLRPLHLILANSHGSHASTLLALFSCSLTHRRVITVSTYTSSRCPMPEPRPRPLPTIGS